MRTKSFIAGSTVLALAILSSIGHSFKTGEQASSISGAASDLLKTLDDGQRKVAVLPADSPQQVGWHFIPKDERKGLELNKMSEAQRTSVDKLLQSVLSEVAHKKTTQIMLLEKLLKELQDKHGGKGPIRDHLRYYVTFFGEPSETGQWGLSFEGHHLSLNFVVQDNKILSSSPQFFATNPATVKSENSVGIPVGTRVLRLEETLAFELVNSMSKTQLASAVIDQEAPREIRAAGSPQPPQDEAIGIAWRDLSKPQQQLLRRLIAQYVKAVPEMVVEERLSAIKESGGYQEIKFAWAGAMNPGVGHYYRVQGPTFLIEFVNTQPDSDGNPANHIHSVWRDMRGDFAQPISG